MNSEWTNSETIFGARPHFSSRRSRWVSRSFRFVSNDKFLEHRRLDFLSVGTRNRSSTDLFDEENSKPRSVYQTGWGKTISGGHFSNCLGIFKQPGGYYHFWTPNKLKVRFDPLFSKMSVLTHTPGFFPKRKESCLPGNQP